MVLTSHLFNQNIDKSQAYLACGQINLTMTWIGQQ